MVKQQNASKLVENTLPFLKKSSLEVISKGVGRKISRGGQRKKTRLKNSTIMSPSTLSVSCMKISADALGY